ncbi:MFS transporter [Streptomyces roseus]|uniref:MFS transporter n=1 Tax=Streptomyces roseus TaxID=66430 RepID=UPI003F4CFD3B
MSASVIERPTAAPSAGAPRRARQGVALAVIAGCNAMIQLDDPIINIALPGIRADLGLSALAASWVIGAYLLTFGGLLLLGGRAGDILGRRRVFVAVDVTTATGMGGGMASPVRVRRQHRPGHRSSGPDGHHPPDRTGQALYPPVDPQTRRPPVAQHLPAGAGQPGSPALSAGAPGDLLPTHEDLDLMPRHPLGPAQACGLPGFTPLASVGPGRQGHR